MDRLLGGYIRLSITAERCETHLSFSLVLSLFDPPLLRALEVAFNEDDNCLAMLEVCILICMLVCCCVMCVDEEVKLVAFILKTNRSAQELQFTSKKKETSINIKPFCT